MTDGPLDCAALPAACASNPAQHDLGPLQAWPVVIGVGNPDCGDDGVGRMVARLLRALLPAEARVEEQDGGALGLIERFAMAPRVILIDAAVTGAPLGTVHDIDCVADTRLPARPGASSHGLGVAAGIELARMLGELPPVCMLYAIEGEAFTPGAPMSAPVRAAAEVLAKRLAERLKEPRA